MPVVVAITEVKASSVDAAITIATGLVNQAQYDKVLVLDDSRNVVWEHRAGHCQLCGVRLYSISDILCPECAIEAEDFGFEQEDFIGVSL